RAQDLAGPVGDDLVGVGVGRGARPRLVDVDGEVRVEAAVGDLLGRLDDGLPDAPVQQTELHVHLGGGPLDYPQRVNERPREAQSADGEVANGPGGGGAVVRVRGALHLAEVVAFDPPAA